MLSKGDLPGPLPTLRVFWDMVGNPLYNNGPNDKGMGLQLAASLRRVFIGFSLGGQQPSLWGCYWALVPGRAASSIP
jgi:nitrate/nitrite transport system permease protein